MDIRKRTLCTILAAALLLCSLTGCGAPVSVGGKTPVRIAFFPNITHSQALIIKAQGTLEETWKDTCRMTWIAYNAGPAEVEAILAGDIDIGYIGPVPALSACAKSKGKVKIISNSTNAGAVLLVRKNAGIHSIRELSGKVVAVPQLGNTQHLCLLHILSENGLAATDKGGDVTIHASANADIVNLFASGSIDAALVPEPWGATIEQDGSADILLDADELMQDGQNPTAVVVVRQEFLDRHPDLVRQFLEAHEAATVYINDNTEKAIDIVNDEIRMATNRALDDHVIRHAFSRLNMTTTLNRDAIMYFGRLSRDEGIFADIPEETAIFADGF